MNLMPHPRGGFSKPHYGEPIVKHIADHPPMNPCWMDEYLPAYSFRNVNCAVKSLIWYWNPCIIALKNWRKKKGIRR